MQKTQRTFTKEFKVEAVQLVQSSKKPLTQIARDLGIADILAQDLGYVFGHSLVAGKTGNSAEEKQHMGRVT
jgi:hypothetical protein